MHRLPTRLLLLLPALAAAGCAAPGPYPSLAPRPAEKLHADGAPERQATQFPDDPALAGEIERLAADARAGSAAFEDALPAADRAVAAAGAAGSDSWVEAQQAVSRVETARARTTSALADLDALALERASGGRLGAGDRERLQAAIAAAQAVADAQVERLQRLKGRLSR